MPRNDYAYTIDIRRPSLDDPFTFTLSCDGAPRATISNLTYDQAQWLSQACRDSIAAIGDIPFAFDEGKGPGYPGIASNLEAAVKHAYPYYQKNVQHIDAWRNDEIGEDAYYASITAIDRRMKADPQMPIRMQDLVDGMADRYFKSSGTQAAKSLGAKTQEASCADLGDIDQMRDSAAAMPSSQAGKAVPAAERA